MQNEDLTYKIAFSLIRGNSRRIAEELLSRIGGSEKMFFDASEYQLEAMLGRKSKYMEEAYRQDLLRRAREEITFIERHGVVPCYFNDEGYPMRLSDCDDAPVMLYTLGDCDLNQSHIVGIVGTRHATPYGTEYAKQIIKDLSQMLDNVIIVSGLAYGIDITAHRAALSAGIPTVAVLAHGLNTIYPSVHRKTAADMVAKGGMLVTDYISSDVMNRGNFIARNRIVAGLCDCVLVVESAEKGGALITASIADGYNRDVFALPGRASDLYSAGCNKLIASGRAVLVTSAKGIIDAMRWTALPTNDVQKELFTDLSPEEQDIIGYINTHGHSTVNELSVGLNITTSRLMSTLIDMEFKGLLINYPGGSYGTV